MRVDADVKLCSAFALLTLLAAPMTAGAATDDGGDGSARVSGFVSETVAYTTADPTHWSRAVTRLQLTAEGKAGERVKWKLGGRVDVDPVYNGSNFYIDRVKDDQRANAFWRENYVSFGAGDLELTLGAQNIVWGEVAGLFFADVVSARDLREFLLPSFDIIRIPQWAARAEYFAGDSKLELVWIPVPTFDNIGKPGSDFYPARLPSPINEATAAVFRDTVKPAHNVSNSNLGLRAGTLIGGWDLAAFYYRNFATSPTFYRLPASSGGGFEPRYDRLSQFGSTVSKDFGSFVMRAEAVYIDGQKFGSSDPSAPQGVVERRTLDWIASAEMPFETVDGRVNVQVFKRHYFGGSADSLLLDTGDLGASLLVSAKLSPQSEPSLQWIQVFGGGGTMVRPRLNWYPARNLVLAVGADLFSGNRNGLFGRYDNRDRAYLEGRYSF